MDWIKLHQKIKDNDIIKDQSALQLFVWIMSNANDQGEVKFSRYSVARELRTNPSTLYSAFERLVSKYKCVSKISSTTHTMIKLSNWDRYQSVKKPVVNDSSTLHQPDSTIYKTKTKENITTNVVIPKDLEPIEKIPSFPKPVPIAKGNFYFALIQYCRSKQGIMEDFTNKGKQFKACKMITDAGYTEDDAKFVIDQMSVEDFWKANPFDLMNVANNMHKYMNRTVMFKPKPKGKYAYN